MAPSPLSALRLPEPDRGPLRAIVLRVAVALGLLVFVAAVTYIGRDGYRDADGGPVSVLDAAYYATVSITTTGYGDVVPVTPGARLATTVLVTPARVLFLIVLVGTTLELLAERSRQAFRRRRWRGRMRDHTIVCGYGTKGRSAIRVLTAQGATRESIVVIDPDPGAVARATGAGHPGLVGNAASTELLTAANVAGARFVIVATDRDDTTVLITLTARELNPAVTITAAAREAENVHLIRQSGADSVITSSDAAGRLLGLATGSPRIVEVLEDLLTVGQGLDLFERPVTPEEVGAAPRPAPGEVVMAVVRGGRILRFDDPAAARVETGDVLVSLGHGAPAR